MPFTQFHTYVTGETFLPGPINANIATLVAAGNNVDNTCVGTNGFYATDFKPTNSIQATFGGTAQMVFGHGLTMSGELDFSGSTSPATMIALGSDGAAVLGLLLNVPASSTDAFQFQTAGSTVFQIDAVGKAITQSNATFGALTVSGASTIAGALKAAPTINSMTIRPGCHRFIRVPQGRRQQARRTR